MRWQADSMARGRSWPTGCSTNQALAAYLQETARLHFLQELTYEEISERINKSVPTVRSYRHKVVKKFREDDRLLTFLQPEDP
jgi:hypothetical protein